MTDVSSFVGQRVFVTGGTGFLGASLIPVLLRRGASVHVLSRGEVGRERLAGLDVSFERGDVADAAGLQAALERVHPHLVFHLAVQRSIASQAARAAAVATNVVGMANLLETVWAAGCERLVTLGSSLEYGPRDEPARESDPLAPTSFYGATKASATLLCRQAFLAEARPIVVLRPYLLYGPWDAAHHLIPSAIRAAFEPGTTLPLTGPGLRRDWIFVEDVVDACLRAAVAEGAVGEVVNVGTGVQWTNEEVVEAVRAVTGARIDVRVGAFPPRPTDRGCWVADPTKARVVLGWEPSHTLAEGLQKTIEWMRRPPVPGGAGVRPTA